MACPDRHWPTLLAAVLLLAAPCVAQESQPAEARLRALEARLRALENQGTVADDDTPTGALDLAGSRVTIKAFADVGFSFQDPRPAGFAHSAFGFGGIDLFVTAQLASDFQILSETVLEAMDSEVGIDQERIWGQWRLDDAFYAKLGLEHAPICHFNRRFHHGKWLYPSVERPLLARFEDDGGILPAHIAGLELGGDAGLLGGQLEYAAVVGNGRGLTPTDRQITTDRNDAKAVELALAFRPAGGDLAVGVAGHFDEVPGDHTGATTRILSTRQAIGSAFLDWRLGPIDLTAEGALMEDGDHTSSHSFHHRVGFVQVALPLERWTPYARMDARRMERGDPYFAPMDFDLDRTEAVLGVRHEFNAQTAIKFELSAGRAETRIGGNVDRDGFWGFALQLAWGF